MKTHSLGCCVRACVRVCACLCLARIINCICLPSSLVFWTCVFVCIWIRVGACLPVFFIYFFLDLYINQQGLALLPSAGHALPSHYIGSGANHGLCVSVSANLSLFFFLLHSPSFSFILSDSSPPLPAHSLP